MSGEAEEYGFEYVAPVQSVPSLAEDVLNGLFSRPMQLPPKYFYDEHGSQLFDQICETREYYPTRTEAALLERYAGEILDRVNPAHILEFGSGTSRKTRYLLEVFHQSEEERCYWPFDICSGLLHDVARDLLKDYPGLEINARCGDFTAGIRHLNRPQGGCLYLFLGGTLGNFRPRHAREFIREVASRMLPGDALLLGVDRVKPHDVLHAAYNDDQGLTAAFNLNVLNVLNRELDANFDPAGFEHQAIYNPEQQQIEMYLVAEQVQEIFFGKLGKQLSISPRDSILTEISRKFTPVDIEALMMSCGLDILEHFEPDNSWYSLVLAGKPSLS